jgi:protein TonB
LALRDLGVSGVVWLRVWVDKTGRPQEIELSKGSGYRLFDEAALRAVQQWRFIPAKNEQQSLASWVEFAVRFEING